SSSDGLAAAPQRDAGVAPTEELRVFVIDRRTIATMMDAGEDERDEVAHPEAFRGPTPREHRIAAGLFVGFAVFFALMFVVLAGWWFRWVIIALAVYSFLYGLRHWMDARHADGGRS
ncbi:MAG: hypothetical protein ABIP55_12195, partial [Tepidisphaeraceae bacterium]